jgi:excisionase family DNA binding protein
VGAARESFVDATTVAEYLGLSYQTVMRWAATGQLKYYQFGNRKKFLLSEIEEWAEAQAKKARAG